MHPFRDTGRFHPATTNRRELLAFAAVLASGACAAEPSSGRRPTSAPIVYDEHGGLMVEARVAGREGLHMLLDTGATCSAIDRAFARELALPLRHGGEVEGSAGVVRAQGTDCEVEVPPFAPARLSCTVYDLGSYDARCAGIPGADFLSRSPFQIFYRDRVWLRGDKPRGAQIPMQIDAGIPRIRALVDGTAIELRIDTGAAFPPGPDAYLNVTAAQAESLHLMGPPHAVFTATGTGGEALKLEVHALESLVVAEKRLDRAFAIVQPRVGYFAREDAVGFLGNSVLDKLDPGFDYDASVFRIGT
jgi:predicted aspartyl protease